MQQNSEITTLDIFKRRLGDKCQLCLWRQDFFFDEKSGHQPCCW